MKSLIFSLFSIVLTQSIALSGCAQPQSGRTNSNNGGNNGSTNGATNGSGGQDMATEQPDLAGADFAGVDLTMPVGGGDMAGMCDVIAQTGCGSNEKCVPTTMGNFCGSKGSTSIPTAGLCGDSQTPPSNNDECVAGDGCVSYSNFDMSKKASLCHQFCKVDADCKQPTLAGVPPKCNGDLQNTNVFKACSISCNPFNAGDGNNGCPMGTSCTYGTDGTMPNIFEYTDCLPFGTGDGSYDCTAHGTQECKPGFICVGINNGTMTTTRCRQVCRAGMNGDCSTAGQTCQALTGPASPKFGFCL